ncbi:metalloregulator ArsR/SmtB family transcription factor [uncultured Propionibacterium sp.]|uniref:ArsR/SmtB family transcription factor n=1 Tax=uncultured Propionibacterium sp. TaxID=218066 RepID=UPI00292FB052|nr:metalloregulator ArsR/SmtB family transcription factor [uncultured Propionibacterium sp.]
MPLTAGEPVVTLFAALADPIRASIVHRLTTGPCDVSELVAWLGSPQPLVPHHLRLLRDAHLVRAARDGRSNIYSLVDDHVAHIFIDAYEHMEEHDHDCHR